MAQSKQQTTAGDEPAVFIDITQETFPHPYPVPKNHPPIKNIWRIGSELIVYERGQWKRYPLDSDEAKTWARFMSHPAAYRDFTARLREYLNTVAEVIETVDRAEVEAFLSQYVREQNHLKRTYMQIAQETARILIQQRFGDASRVPKEEIVKIVEDQAEMCANHYRQTLEFMERGL